MRGGAKTIVTAALIVGAMDFAYASLMTAYRGGSVIKLWQYVAGGLLGPGAGAMGVSGAVCGVVFHFLIMAAFSAAIYGLSVRTPLIGKYPVPAGLAYGVVIWLVMNFLVVPLSRIGAKTPALTLDAIMNWGFAMHLVIGLALVLITKRGLRPVRA